MPTKKKKYGTSSKKLKVIGRSIGKRNASIKKGMSASFLAQNKGKLDTARRRRKSAARLKAAEEREKRKEEREDEEKARKKMIKNRKFNRSKRGKAYNAIKRAGTYGGKGLGKAGSGGLDLIKRAGTTGKIGLKSAGARFDKFKNSRTNASKLGRNACFKEYVKVSRLNTSDLNKMNPATLKSLKRLMQNSKCKNSKSLINPIERAKALITGTTYTRQDMKELINKVVNKNNQREDAKNQKANEKIRKKNTQWKYQNGKDLFLKF